MIHQGDFFSYLEAQPDKKPPKPIKNHLLDLELEAKDPIVKNLILDLEMEARDSTNMNMLESQSIQPEDI